MSEFGVVSVVCIRGLRPGVGSVGGVSLVYVGRSCGGWVGSPLGNPFRPVAGVVALRCWRSGGGCGLSFVLVGRGGLRRRGLSFVVWSRLSGRGFFFAGLLVSVVGAVSRVGCSFVCVVVGWRRVSLLVALSSWRRVVSVSVVGFCGSRSLPSVPVAGGLVSRVVGSVVACRLPVAVGCCVGADAAVLSARLSLPFAPSSSRVSLSVFAALACVLWLGVLLLPFPVCCVRVRSPSLLGTGSLLRLPFGFGLAGGLPFLCGRVSALARCPVSSLSAGGGVLVCFLGAGRSFGSVLAVRAAAAAGVPVFVFPVGRPASSLPAVGSRRWVAVGGSGVWSRAFRLV